MADSFYLPLDLNRDTVRLLVLQPGLKDCPLQCDLLLADLDDNPIYETISYRWAKQSQQRQICVKDSQLTVQHNVYEALCYLRLVDATRVVWIDAVCIDQANDVEKAKQVNIMKRIYSQCSQCLIWLVDVGSQDFTLVDVTAAFDTIRLVAACAQNEEQITKSRVPASLRDRARRTGAAKALKGVMATGNSWWHRIWTVQEVILPCLKTMVWRSQILPWETCTLASMAIIDGQLELDAEVLGPELVDTLYDNLNFITPVSSLAMTAPEAIQRPLLTFHRWRMRRATDPRDMLYGLMGLFQPGALKRSDCDYTINAAKVFTRLTLDLIELEGGLTPLCGLRGEAHATSDLPSWALDLVRPDVLINEGTIFWEQIDRYDHFGADGKDMPFTLVNSRDLSILILRGLQIGTVKSVDEGIAVDEKVVVPDQDIMNVLKRRIRLIENSHILDYPGDSTWVEAFWRTSLGNAILEDERVKRLAHNEDQVLFEEYVESGRRNEATSSIQSMTVNQSFFVTENGYFGIGPPDLRVGDECWVINGSNVPFVLRPQAEPAGYVFLGDGYVHGVMDGEFARKAVDPWTELSIY